MDSLSNFNKIKELYQEFETNKNTLDPAWKKFFSDLDDESLTFITNNNLSNNKNKINSSKPNELHDNEYTANSLRARLLIRAYRIAGHLKADLDPLGLAEKKYIPDLDPKTYGIEKDDLDKEVFIDGVFGINTISIRKLIEILEKN